MEELKKEEVQEVQTENKQPKPEEKIVCKSAITLRIVGFIILIIDIIFLFFIHGNSPHKEDIFAICFLGFLPALAVWAFAMAVATIAEDIHKMAHKKTEA